MLSRFFGRNKKKGEDAAAAKKTSAAKYPQSDTEKSSEPLKLKLKKPVANTVMPAGQFLVKEGLISRADLQQTLEIQKELRKRGSIEESNAFICAICVDQGFVTEEKVAKTFSTSRNLPLVSMSRVTIREELIPLIEPEIANRHLVFPVDKIGQVLLLATFVPLDNNLIKTIEQKTGLHVKLSVCKRSEIREYVDKYYNSDGEVYEPPKSVREPSVTPEEAFASMVEDTDSTFTVTAPEDFSEEFCEDGLDEQDVEDTVFDDSVSTHSIENVDHRTITPSSVPERSEVYSPDDYYDPRVISLKPKNTEDQTIIEEVTNVEEYLVEASQDKETELSSVITDNLDEGDTSGEGESTEDIADPHFAEEVEFSDEALKAKVISEAHFEHMIADNSSKIFDLWQLDRTPRLVKAEEIDEVLFNMRVGQDL